MLSDTEKLVLEWTDALTTTPAECDDDLRARMRQVFSEKQLVELTNLIAWENARARFNRGFGIEPEGYAANA